jgi:hypothetical protein
VGLVIVYVWTVWTWSGMRCVRPTTQKGAGRGDICTFQLHLADAVPLGFTALMLLYGVLLWLSLSGQLGRRLRWVYFTVQGLVVVAMGLLTQQPPIAPILFVALLLGAGSLLASVGAVVAVAGGYTLLLLAIFSVLGAPKWQHGPGFVDGVLAPHARPRGVAPLREHGQCFNLCRGSATPGAGSARYAGPGVGGRDDAVGSCRFPAPCAAGGAGAGGDPGSLDRCPADPAGQDLQQMVDAFNKSHTGIALKPVCFSNANVLQPRLLAAIQQHRPPALSQTDAFAVATYVDQGAVQDLTPYIHWQEWPQQYRDHRLFHPAVAERHVQRGHVIPALQRHVGDGAMV